MSNPLDQILVSVNVPKRMLLRNAATKETQYDKDGKPSYIEHVSADSDAARKFWRDNNAKHPNPDAAQRERNMVEYFAAITTGWYLVGRDGLPIDYQFSPKNARDLYGNSGAIDIIAQLRESASDLANFIAASSSS